MYSMSEPRFRVKGWISDEEFRRLLEFSRYRGRVSGYAVFEVDQAKVEKNGFTVDDIIAILSSLNVPAEDIEAVKRALVESRKVTVYLGEDGWLRIRSRLRLKEHLKELGFWLPYDAVKREYKAPPFKYRAIIEHLRSKGFYVEDKLGLLDNADLPRKVVFQGQLRPYQEEALEAWKNAGMSGIIALPTGAGKTVIADAAIADLGKRTLVVVITREHVKQWVESIRRFTDAGPLVGAYYGEEKRLAPITVTTYQTAFRKTDLFADKFAFLVFDEVHHLPADKFRLIATRMPAPYRLGLSATIEREDGRHEELFPLLGGIVYKTSPGELTRMGYLAPYIVRRVKVDLLPEEKRKYETLRRQYNMLARGLPFNQLVEKARKGDPEAIQAVRINTEMRKLVQNSEAKLKAVEKIVRDELARGSKIIVFTQLRSQAEEIARRVGGLLLHGGLDKKTRKAVLERFRNAKSGVLVVTTVGDEGLDIPDANVGIIASGTGNPRQFIQRLGRLLRPKEGKEARLYEIIVAGTSEEYQSRKRRRTRLL